MNKTFTLKASLILAAMLAVPFAQAANISKDEYKAAKTRISAEEKAEKKLCDSQSGNAKDICVEEAKAKEKIAMAELEYSHTGKQADAEKIPVAKAKAMYEVAKERCDDKAGNDKDLCVKEAKATETKALADAKLSKKVGEAKSDAVTDKRDADYKVAAQKCEALAGDAKTACVADAKMKFGKS